VKNRKHVPERFQIKGEPEVYDDLLLVLKLAGRRGPGTEVIRLPDGVLMAQVPKTGKSLSVELDEDKPNGTRVS
jgi:hypothetical protein